MPPRWYVLLLAAIGAGRLYELSISRRNERLRGGTRAGAKTFPVMVAAHAALVTLPLLEVRGHPERRPQLVWGVVLAAASALRVWSIGTLGDSWNARAAVPQNVVPVTRGPYRYIRHPNYVAVILEFAAVPLIAGAWRSALILSLLNAAVLTDRIAAEERLLGASPAYRAAFAGKARFIPGVL
ncbi:MAG TPA: isoprenylcysteine carboxylmethyltransferase family protein [Candidatus Dormibacteraeota bacterium]|nr:isoprenylcysteine carboxylmethyltransferase family protein [Candidatus Dormibacteraeota bacterium]